jgi:hypothetical protein
MPAEPTSYERVNVIIPRSLKRELIKYAKENESSMTRIMRLALREYIAKTTTKGKSDVRK